MTKEDASFSPPPGFDVMLSSSTEVPSSGEIHHEGGPATEKLQRVKIGILLMKYTYENSTVIIVSWHSFFDSLAGFGGTLFAAP